MSDSDDDIARRAKAFDQNLPPDRHNPHAKETFDELIARAAKPVPPSQGIQSSSEDCNDTQARSHTPEDTSDW